MLVIAYMFALFHIFHAAAHLLHKHAAQGPQAPAHVQRIPPPRAALKAIFVLIIACRDIAQLRNTGTLQHIRDTAAGQLSSAVQQQQPPGLRGCKAPCAHLAHTPPTGPRSR